MRKIFKKLVKNWLVFGLVFFVLSRFVVYTNPPYDVRKPEGFRGYSDVKHDYERYANIWWYGLPPYFKHLYEYPPGAILPTVFPLFLDQSGIGKYYQNYRAQIMVFDFILFFSILAYLQKLKTKKVRKVIAMLFYIVGGLAAKDFLYDGLDLMFSGTIAIGLIIFFLTNQKKLVKSVLFWCFFWLSVAVKLMSAPLAAVYFFIKSVTPGCFAIDDKLKKGVLASILGMGIVWGLPLVYFRSSLSVFIVYNLGRSFKYASFPYFITATINAFTQTETKIDKPPDFSLAGPYSGMVLSVFNIILPLAILGVIGYCFWIVYRKKKFDPYMLAVKMTLVYVFTFFLASKVYSQPFPIWTIPLVALVPFTNTKKQVKMMLFCLLLIVIDTTNYLNLGTFGLRTFWGPLTFGFLRSIIKFGTMAVLLGMSVRLPVREKLQG